VCGITKGAEIGVVGSDDEDAAAGACEAVELLDGADDGGDMLDHVDGADLVEGVVAEGIREMIEVAEEVGAAGGIAVNAYGARVFVDSAADIENAHQTILARPL